VKWNTRIREKTASSRKRKATFKWQQGKAQYAPQAARSLAEQLRLSGKERAKLPEK
jgi:hypothetical protein